MTDLESTQYPSRLVPNKAVFPGLVYDEDDNPCTTAMVGNEACYVINDHGFLIHVPSDPIDRHVLQVNFQHLGENKDEVAEQASKMFNLDGLFDRAMLKSALDHLDEHMDEILAAGLAEDQLLYLGMTGFKIIINRHGEVVDIRYPSKPSEEE
jgi:hypothetical protein